MIRKNELKKVLQKRIGFEFEVASNISRRKLLSMFNAHTDWNAKVSDDCSIDNENMKYRVEIKTPPTPAGSALRKLKRALKFFQDNEIQTNYSTGVHVNISFRNSGYNYDIDGTKLQILVDDLKWLERFDRVENEYCESPKFAINELICDYKDYLRNNGGSVRTATVEDYVDYINQNGSDDDCDLLEKYCAVNVNHLYDKNPYVEFRVIGGENYHWRFDEISRAINDFSKSMDMSLGGRYNYLVKRFVKNMAGFIEEAPAQIIPH